LKFLTTLTFLPVLGKFLIILKKIFSRLRFCLIEAVFWLRLLSRTLVEHQYQKRRFTLFWGKNWGEKMDLWKFEKKRFFGFYGRTVAPIPNFGVHQWKKREKYNQNQKNSQVFEKL